jgi:hypothetical protein
MNNDAARDTLERTPPGRRFSEALWARLEGRPDKTVPLEWVFSAVHFALAETGTAVCDSSPPSSSVPVWILLTVDLGTSLEELDEEMQGNPPQAYTSEELEAGTLQWFNARSIHTMKEDPARGRTAVFVGVRIIAVRESPEEIVAKILRAFRGDS